MREGLQSVAEFMRHPGTDQTGVTEFYTDIVGLPVLRAYPAITMLWAGEDLSFELKYDIEPRDDDRSSPESAKYVPIFRSHDLQRTRVRLSEGGYEPVSATSDAHGETFFVLGPDRLVTGFQYREPQSELGADAEALRRWHAGPARLEGVGPLPADLHYLSRIRLRSSDVEHTSGHLETVFGLDVVAREGASVIHSLGDTVVLEVCPGGIERQPPSDRNDASGVLLLRVHDLDALARDAAAAGAVAVGAPVEFDGGVRIRYYAEPDGAVLGFVQRGWAGDGVEDQEAARRWARRPRFP